MLLTVDSLTKQFKDTKVVDNISFSLDYGKCIALLGPNGAGKTTTIRILAGLLKPTSGKVVFSEANATTDIRKFIGYLPQYPVFPSWMTGLEFLIFSGELAHLKRNVAKERAESLMVRVGIADALNKRISTYSGGMKQRLGIAQAMIHSPQLLMLDEPVSSLDPIGRREILSLMEELKKEMTILFSTHILNDAEEVSDELILLNHGKIIESGKLTTLRNKYQTSIIELSFQENHENILQQINALPSVSKSLIEKNTIKVVTENIAEARTELLTLISEEKLPIIHFEVNRASLEELFMKAVSQ
ncbi:ABC transporter ATP-binding protein [Oceanobacillus sp. CAU 1775]